MTHEISLLFASLGEELRGLKLAVLKECGIERTSFKLSFEDPLPDELVWASRVFHMDYIELYFIHSIGHNPLDRIKTIVSPQNELRTLTFLTKEIAQLADLTLRISVLERFNLLLNQYSQNIPNSVSEFSLQDDRSTALKHWAEANKYLSHVELAEFSDTGRGMVLVDTLEANQPLIECDAGLFMSIFAARKSPVLGPVFAQLPDLDDDSKLMLFVLYEKYVNPASFWKPYLDLLPESVDSALSFSEEDLAFVAGTTLGVEISYTQQHLLESYEEIMASVATFPLFDRQTFSWERFKWTRSIFDSRGFNLTLDGKARNCLLPFIDSINSTHFTHLQSRGFVDESRRNNSELGTFVLPSLVPCSNIGSQIFLNYGGFSTRELVLFYGFAYDEENPYDLYNLTLDLPEDDYAAERMALASTLGITTEHYLRASSVSMDLVDYLSLLVLPPTLVMEAANYDSNSLQKLLRSEDQLLSVKDILISMLQALIGNMEAENPFLAEPPSSFPSTCAKIGFLYTKSQHNILTNSIRIVTNGIAAS